MLYIRDIIKKKRNNQELSEEEMDFFISSYNKDEILIEQAAALVTMMNVRKLSIKEMSFLAKAISESGTKLNIFEISNKLVDIHPIGGMDDKIIIMLMAILNALELPIIETYGREIGIHDKLPNLHALELNDENKEKLIELIENHETLLIKEPKDLAPVESKLYKLRNDIACNDDISIIAVNLISQELAIGFKNVVFDISYGEKAYVKTAKDAKKLAVILKKLGNNENIGINVKCVITKLNEPVGKSFGTTIEVREALAGLSGNISKDVEELLLEIGNCILSLQTGCTDKHFNKKRILEAIHSQKAYNKLLSMTKDEVINTSLQKPVPVISDTTGYISKIDVSDLRVTSQFLNSIRHSELLELKYGTGVEICKKVGDKVNKGDILGYIYTNEEIKVQKSVSDLKEAFGFSDKRIKKESRIKEIL